MSDPKQCVIQTPLGPLHYELRRSPRRRSIEISINRHHTVRVAAPRFVAEREIRAFILEKAGWISRRLKESRRRPPRRFSLDPGQTFFFLGQRHPLEVQEKPVRQARIVFEEDRWRMTVPQGLSDASRTALVKSHLVKWYRRQAKEIFGSRVFHFSRIMGLEPVKITVRTQKRIWGSCHHHNQSIFLNWLLVLAPLDVIDYVVAHELAHLKVPNHSPRFWAIVRKTLPDYQSRQQWLKTHQSETDLFL